MNRIINIMINQIIRRFVNGGINQGMRHLSSKGKPAVRRTAVDHNQDATARDTAKRARQAAKLTRRLGR